MLQKVREQNKTYFEYCKSFPPKHQGADTDFAIKILQSESPWLAGGREVFCRFRPETFLRILSRFEIKDVHFVYGIVSIYKNEFLTCHLTPPPPS
jgi:hypothetical protein